MRLFEKLFDWTVDPSMPRRAARGDVASGIAFVAAAVVAEKRRRDEEVRRREAAKKIERARSGGRTADETVPIHYHTELVPDIMYKSGSDSVQGPPESGFSWAQSTRRRRPDMRAPVLSFSARLLMYVKQRCDGYGKIAYTRSGISRQVYSRLTSYDDSQADKLTVMKFCIGLQLGRSDADLLMKSAGFAFSGTIPVDQAFVYAIDHRIWNIQDVNEMLVRNSLPELNLQF